MSTPERREFIPALREVIVANVPGTAEDINKAIDNWRDGHNPNDLFEQGVFGVCNKIAEDLDEGESA